MHTHTLASILAAKTKQELYSIAGALNNHPRHVHTDKVTFMAFLDLEEARAYVINMLKEIGQ